MKAYMVGPYDKRYGKIKPELIDIMTKTPFHHCLTDERIQGVLEALISDRLSYNGRKPMVNHRLRECAKLMRMFLCDYPSLCSFIVEAGIYIDRLFYGGGFSYMDLELLIDRDTIWIKILIEKD